MDRVPFSVVSNVASMVVAAVQPPAQAHQEPPRRPRAASSAADKVAALTARVDRLEAHLALTWRVAGGVAACAVLYRFMSHIMVASALGFVAWQAIAYRRK